MKLRNGFKLVLVVIAIAALVFGGPLACGGSAKPELCSASIEVYKAGSETKVMIEIAGGTTGECKQTIDLGQFAEALREDGRISEETDLAYNPKTGKLDGVRKESISGDVGVNGPITICTIDSEKPCAKYFITPERMFVRAQKEE